MEKLTLKSVLKKGKYANMSIADLAKEKGAIISMIKEGYEFDDEVLEVAKLKKIINNTRAFCCVGVTDSNDGYKSKLPKDTTPVKQILSELNTLDNIGGVNEEENCEFGNKIDIVDEYDDFE